ncbi:MAG: alanine dehydrogenase, partial [Dehalococcoidia bacterium]|nr:alanine dehydrogenase [Dehalococcoidia bacterium]
AVPNMPGAVPRTSSRVLSGLTVSYALAMANLGVEDAVRRNTALGHGVNVWRGKVTHPAVAAALGREFIPLEQAMATASS